MIVFVCTKLTLFSISLSQQICQILKVELNILYFWFWLFCCHGPQTEDALYVCELCQKYGKGVQSVPSLKNGKTQVLSLQEEHKLVSLDTKLSPQLPWSHGKVCNLNHFKWPCFPFRVNWLKLLILLLVVKHHTCVHRLHVHMAKSINLPKVLFFLFFFGQLISTSISCFPTFCCFWHPNKCNFTGNESPRKLRILCLHGFRQNASSFKGRTASLAKKLKNIVELVFVDAPHELPFVYQPCITGSHGECASSSLQQTHPPPSENCRKKFAWLVAPDFNISGEVDWKIANGSFDPLQYLQQTDGFDVSLAYLKSVFSQKGPFDGILGFSQGAAMAALVSAQQERLKSEMDFRFVILCSGFAIKLAEFECQAINCPSLHIFGSDRGKDRQIANQASRDLASLFDDGCSVIIEHDSGHIIPTRSPYIDEIRNFLHRFLQQN